MAETSLQVLERTLEILPVDCLCVHDDMAGKGGIDKFTLQKSKVDILKELEYKMTGAKGCGVVFGIDHRIPNGTPIENYRYYVKTGRELLGLPAPKEAAHVRMAF